MGAIAALDFDRCTSGDPALDLGHLLTQLHRLTVRRPGKLPPLSALRRGILAAYQSWAPPDGDLARRVAWYEQVVLLRKIHFLLTDVSRHPDPDAQRARRDEAIALMDGAGG
jgi:aminoglycoside phosphotransferase (APT) family kinase protein